MSESDHIAAALPEQSDAPDPVMDEETNLRPGFVEKVLDAVEAGDDETARALVRPLHPADVADLIELARADEREGLVKALAGIISPDVTLWSSGDVTFTMRSSCTCSSRLHPTPQYGHTVVVTCCSSSSRSSISATASSVSSWPAMSATCCGSISSRRPSRT